jgi:hypothetical protein
MTRVWYYKKGGLMKERILLSAVRLKFEQSWPPSSFFGQIKPVPSSFA